MHYAIIKEENEEDKERSKIDKTGQNKKNRGIRSNTIYKNWK